MTFTKEYKMKRFHNCVEVKGENDCWPFKKFTGKDGYGRISLQKQKKLKTIAFVSIAAHRLAYELFVEPITQDDVICHKCDNPKCSNPKHLFKGTHTDNMVDMTKKRRHPNIKLFPEQVKEIRASKLGAIKLSRKYGVSHTVIGDIKRKKLWRWVI